MIKGVCDDCILKSTGCKIKDQIENDLAIAYAVRQKI